MKHILFFLFIIILFNSCIQKDFTKINYGTSTMKVSTGDIMMHDYGGKDSCLIFIRMYSIGYGSMKQFKYAKELKQIESECYINDIKYNLEKNDMITLKVPAGKLTISANDIYGFRQPLQKRKIYLFKNGSFDIFIYLMYDGFNMKKEKPKR